MMDNLLDENDHKEIARLNSLLKNDKSDAEILVRKGQILYSKMADDLAIDAFNLAIQLDPKYVDAYFWLAECLYYHLADWEQAEIVALKGLSIDPNKPNLVELIRLIRESIERWNLLYKNKNK